MSRFISGARDEEAQEKTKGFEVGYELFGMNGAECWDTVSRSA